MCSCWISLHQHTKHNMMWLLIHFRKTDKLWCRIYSTRGFHSMDIPSKSCQVWAVIQYVNSILDTVPHIEYFSRGSVHWTSYRKISQSFVATRNRLRFVGSFWNMTLYHCNIQSNTTMHGFVTIRTVKCGITHPFPSFNSCSLGMDRWVPPTCFYVMLGFG